MQVTCQDVRVRLAAVCKIARVWRRWESAAAYLLHFISVSSVPRLTRLCLSHFR